MTRQLRIGHAIIKLISPPGTLDFYDTPTKALSASWIPGTDNLWYGRRWRIGRRTEIDEGVWGGKVGFTKEDVTDYWDSKNNDFQDIPVEVGAAVPFVIDIQRQLLTFQYATSRKIPRDAVTAHLNVLLNKASAHVWEIKPLPSELTYEVWRKSVDRITRFKATLNRPNPRYPGPYIRQGIEDLEADVMTIEVKSKRINERSTIMKECTDHQKAGYGSTEHTGPNRATGKPSTYRSNAGDRTDMIQSNQSEATFDELREVQRGIEIGAENTDDDKEKL